MGDYPNRKRGTMSVAELAELIRLAETMRDPTPGSVARKMNRHPATIQWHMLKNGLLRRSITYRSGSYVRNGRRCYHFDRAEDKRLTALRVAGVPIIEIARRLNSEFGRERNGHSVSVRLVLLAGYDVELREAS